jgi:hypothetical protein
MLGGTMGTDIIIPDFEWYSTQGAKRASGTPRCPFASTERCPRYHHSRSLLGEAGFTRMDASEDERLDQRWRQLGLMPQTAEQSTTVISSGDKTQGYWNFCPEVSYDSFGHFASDLHRYADEIDIDNAYHRLGKIKAPRTDWRWSWALVRPMHYSECPLYSVLSVSTALTRADDGTADVTLKVWGLAEVRFKWRIRETWKAIKEWTRQKTARSAKHVQAER